MKKVAFDSLERGGVIVTVAYTFVRYDFHGDKMMTFPFTVGRKVFAVELIADGDKHGNIAEIVQMVINCGNAERAEVRDEHGPVERADIEQRLRQTSEIVEKTKEPYRGTENQTRHLGQFLCGIVKSRRGRQRLVHQKLKLLIHIVDIIARVKNGVDTGARRFKSHFLFDVHVLSSISKS